MNVDSNLEESKLTIALDVRHPFAYLALGPALELAQDLDIAINWLPRASEPLRPPSVPGSNDDRGIRHRRNRAQMIAREIVIYAEAQGLQLEEPYRNAPPDAAHMAILYMRSHATNPLEPFLIELFRRYWSLSLDANDTDAVANLVAEFGESASDFIAWSATQGTAALERISKDLDEVGATAMPAYLACGEAFHGRQHLPMIRWLLEDQTGPIPI